MFLFGWLGRKRAVAARAEALVKRVLSDDERAQLGRDGFLEVASPNFSGRRYRIPRQGSPVAVLEPSGRVLYLCLQPQTPIAPQELLVVHKLMLEGAEDEYWQRANRVGRPMGRGVGRRLLG